MRRRLSLSETVDFREFSHSLRGKGGEGDRSQCRGLPGLLPSPQWEGGTNNNRQPPSGRGPALQELNGLYCKSSAP